MEIAQLTREQITLIAAVIAMIGAIVVSTISLFSLSRSKYIDTITMTRISWVKELRTEFSELMSAFDKVVTSETRQAPPADKEAEETKILESMMLLNLKLNRRSSIDQEIHDLMSRLLWSVKDNNLRDYRIALRRLATVVEELLKEEWESAKLEASGPLRQIRIRWRKHVRKKHRDRRRQEWLDEDGAASGSLK